MNAMNKKAHTLLEIIVTVVILSMVVGGLVATFVSGKRWLMHSRLRVSGGEIGKYFLDPLAMQVRQDQWVEAAGAWDYSNNLAIGTRPGTPVTINNKIYTPTYTVDFIPNLLPLDKYVQARKVKVEIKWVE